MKISAIETFPASAGWRNWLLVKVLADRGTHGISEGTLNGFIRTTEAGVRDLLSWNPAIDPTHSHLSLPDAPGLGIDLNPGVAQKYPCDPQAYLNIYQPGWERRLGQSSASPPQVAA